jgi:hypothetical protein
MNDIEMGYNLWHHLKIQFEIKRATDREYTSNANNNKILKSFFNILNQRLMNHIVSCKLPNNKGFGHRVWKWQFSNLKIAAAILKLTGIILPDEYL